MSEAKDGWYSAQQCLIVGSNIYQSEDGRLVEVTCIGDKPMWDDALFVARVTEWKSKGVTASGAKLKNSVENLFKGTHQ